MAAKKRTPDIFSEISGEIREDQPRSNRGYKPVPKKIKRTYEIDASLPREMKIQAAIHDITINQLVENAIIDYLKKIRKK